MKKITFIIRSMGLGGAERVVSLLSQKLMEKYKVSIITFNQSDKEYDIDKRIQRYDLKFDYSKKYIIKNILKLRTKCEQLDSDIFLSFDTLANLYSIIALLGKKKKLGISERNAPKQTQYRLHTKILRKILYIMADFYIFQTEQAAKYYSKRILNRSYIIFNPVNEGLSVKEYTNIRNEIVAIGRLTYQKNYELLITGFSEFWKKHQEYQLVIYGDGELREQLEKLCEKLEIQHAVKFKGKVLDVHAEIVNSKIYVLTSHFEGIPNALLETMAMGFPVISTDCPVGGPRLLIENNVNGLLVPENDQARLIDAMNYLVEHEEKALEMGVNAQKVREKYALDAICLQWEKMIEKETA